MRSIIRKPNPLVNVKNLATATAIGAGKIFHA